MQSFSTYAKSNVGRFFGTPCSIPGEFWKSLNLLDDLEEKIVNLAWWPKSFSNERTEARAVRATSHLSVRLTAKSVTINSVS